MSDTAPQTAPPPAPQSQEPVQQAQQAQGSDMHGPVPYARFAEVNTKYQELAQKLAQIETAQRQAGEAKLAEEGRYKDLLAAREKELAEERATRQRLTVAAKKGLVGELAPLADRLRGTTEAELEADADTLLGLARKPGGPGVPPPGGGGRSAGQPDLASMTPAQIREALAKGQIKLT